jgi:hypothetical protein
MIKNIFPLLVLLIFTFNSTAQFKLGKLFPPKNFIYLTDSTLLKQGEFIIDKKGFQKRFYYSNGAEINIGDISFYQDDYGYFAVQQSNTIFGQKDYSSIKRMEEGSIDIFKVVTQTSSGNGGSLFSSTYFYSKKFDGIKNLNFDNLSNDLTLNSDENLKAPNERILSHLQKGKKKKKAGKVLFIAGIGAMLTGVTILLTNETNKSARKAGFIFSGIGTVGLVTVIAIKPERSYLKAIREYNRFY